MRDLVSVHRLEVIDYKAEAVARDSHKLSLVLYGVSEEVVDESYVDEADIPYDHLISHVLAAVNKETKEEYRRLGRSSSKPRPLSLSFASDEEKHVFLKYVKTLRQADSKMR